MKIENNIRQKFRFDSLMRGDVFECIENIYMKTYEDSESGLNVVNLSTNDLESLAPYEMVIKLEAKLIIE